MRRRLGRSVAIAAVLVVLAGCSSVGHVVSSAPPDRPAAQPEAGASLDLVGDLRGEPALEARLVELAGIDRCLYTGEPLLAVPDEEDLRAVDELVATGGLVNGRDTKGRVVGDFEAVLSAYKSNELVDKSSDGTEVWFIATDPKGPRAFGFKGFATPAGNLVWLRTFEATGIDCPKPE